MDERLLSKVVLAQDLWPMDSTSVQSLRGRSHGLQARLPLRQMPVRVDRTRTSHHRRTEGRTTTDPRALSEVQGPALESSRANAPPPLLKSCGQHVEEQWWFQWPQLWTDGLHPWSTKITSLSHETSSWPTFPSSTGRSSTVRRTHREPRTANKSTGQVWR